jgi:hypothetical protein
MAATSAALAPANCIASRNLELSAPDLIRILLNPSRCRIELGQLPLCSSGSVSMVEQQCA